jgi:hypothetical protein
MKPGSKGDRLDAVFQVYLGFTGAAYNSLTIRNPPKHSVEKINC